VASLCATTRYEDLRDADYGGAFVFLHPLNAIKEPDMSFVISAVESIAKICHDGMLIVLESTAYPGAAEETILPRLAHHRLQGWRECVRGVFRLNGLIPATRAIILRNTPKVHRWSDTRMY